MIIICVQARMGSTRLPGKPLLKVLGRPLLSYLLDRLKSVREDVGVALLTTSKPCDEPLLALAKSLDVLTFCGSEDNVLERYTLAARHLKATTVIRICGDCPLLDPLVVRKVLEVYEEVPGRYDYVSNTLERTYPRGMDVEVFSAKALEIAYAKAHEFFEKEHVTPFFYGHPDQFSLGHITYPRNLSHWRMTLDTTSDFEVIAPLLAAAYPSNPAFTLEELAVIADSHPEWMRLNSHIQQKTLK